MPDKKPTDSEIVKALEICSTYKGKCTDCPAFVKVDRSNCKKVLLGAVEIINRQKADLIDEEKQLQEALKSMAVNKTKVIDCEKEINRLQAENESVRRKSLLEAASKFAGHSDYHGDTILCKLICMAEGKEVGTAKPLDMSEIKAEAYKEFAERFKKKLSQKYTTSLWKVYCEEIDNLLKELVGEDDA